VEKRRPAMKLWSVDDVMTRDVATVREDTPYRDVVELLIGRRIGAVPVLDRGDRVTGIVSESDLLPKVAAVDAPRQGVLDAWWHRHERAKAAGRIASDVMTTPVVTVLPSVAVAAAARRMQEESVKRLPVVNGLGKLVGIVTRSNLLRIHLRPDGDIRHDVAEEVFREILAAERGEICVRTSDAVVSLTGRTHLRSTGIKAVEAAERIRGVVAVVDDLTCDIDDRMAIGSENGVPFGVA
jgi:CBS-domain-containing membrane protein